METVVIECDSCSSLSEVAEGFPDQSWGQVNQITCPQCSRPIEIDLTGGPPAIRGGRLVRTSRVSLEPAARTASTSLSPHTIEADSSGSPSVRSPLSRVGRGRPGGDVDFLADAEVLSSPDPSLVSAERVELEELELEPDSAALSARAAPREQAREERPSQPPHEVPHPPRPWELRALHEQHLAEGEPEEDEERLTPLLPAAGDGVRLTQDGRLVNQADESPRRPPWVAIGLSAAGLAALVLLSQSSLFSRGATASRLEAVEPPTPAASRETVESAPQETLPEPEPELAPSVPAASATPAPKPRPARASGVALASTSSSSGSTTPSWRADAAPPAAPKDPGAAVVAEGEPEQLPPFSRDAATTALDQARQSALACRAPDDPYGVAQVAVTFAPSGKVTSATVTGHPFAGTEIGGCIATHFRGARVPAFDGQFVTVTKSVVFQ